MNWTKKTDAEIQAFEDKNDFTGGYEFLPWLWYMKKGYLGGIALLLIIGGITAFTQAYNQNVAYVAAGFFGVALPILFSYLLKRQYNKLQKGISQ